MTAAHSYAFHPAPAAPAPAPSQIRFPRLPQERRRSDLPLPGAPSAKMVLLQAPTLERNQDNQSQQAPVYPTWLH